MTKLIVAGSSDSVEHERDPTAATPWSSRAGLPRHPGPDEMTRVAVTDEDTCDVGSFSTVITAGVNLVSTTPPLRDIVVLGVDTGGNDNERPLVAWTAPDVLRVTVGLRSILKVLTRQVEGVRVNVQFDPDDPAARAAWLKQTGLPADDGKQ